MNNLICFSGRTAFIGVGFSDRSDSFDLNVALQDHFKWLKKSEEIEKEKEDPKPELDLRFKEGETIKINMKITVSVNTLFVTSKMFDLQIEIIFHQLILEYHFSLNIFNV